MAKSTKAPSGLKTIRLTPDQLAALRAMAEKDTTLKALLPQHKQERSGNGSEVQFCTMVMRDPKITIEVLHAAFPSLKEDRLKFLLRQGQNAISAAKAAGRWNDKLAEVKPVHQPAEVKPAEVKPVHQPAVKKAA